MLVCFGLLQFVSVEMDNVKVTVPGLGEYTCFDLDVAAYEDHEATTFDAACSVLQDAGATACCQAYVESCYNVCGVGRTFSYNNNGRGPSSTYPIIETTPCPSLVLNIVPLFFALFLSHNDRNGAYACVARYIELLRCVLWFVHGRDHCR
jgi:hypothetical protein